jgi:DNA invertase Pin-like site-specific DNA recombinase
MGFEETAPILHTVLLSSSDLKMNIGYARTSTVDQIAGFDPQLRELKTINCEKIFQEQASSISKRIQLQAAIDLVREGDILVATKIDRLARSVSELMTIIQALAQILNTSI